MNEYMNEFQKKVSIKFKLPVYFQNIFEFQNILSRLLIFKKYFQKYWIHYNIRWRMDNQIS